MMCQWMMRDRVMGSMISERDKAVRLDRVAGHAVRTTAAAGLVLLAPLCPSILEPDLDTCFRQSNPHGKFFTCKDIRIVGS